MSREPCEDEIDAIAECVAERLVRAPNDKTLDKITRRVLEDILRAIERAQDRELGATGKALLANGAGEAPCLAELYGRAARLMAEIRERERQLATILDQAQTAFDSQCAPLD